jgi:hypothetical protein
LWWFGVVPAWTHHLTIKQLEPTEIYTNEHGGPVKTWNHRLTFEPLDEHHCRYTDEIETEDGLRGADLSHQRRQRVRHRTEKPRLRPCRTSLAVFTANPKAYGESAANAEDSRDRCLLPAGSHRGALAANTTESTTTGFR